MRILSKSGVCSRKQAADVVKQGRVKVNGKIISDPGFKISIRDKVLLDGRPLQKKIKKYYIFNKPAGCVTTRDDELGRETVYKYLEGVSEWVFPVGRLDKDSEGLLLFTNDTAFGDFLTDPKNLVERTYEVLVGGEVSGEELEKIRAGIDIGRGEKTQPVYVKYLSKQENGALLRMTLTEGKNREIRRIFESLGKEVVRLKRLQFGKYRLGELKPGEWREVQK